MDQLHLSPEIEIICNKNKLKLVGMRRNLKFLILKVTLSLTATVDPFFPVPPNNILLTVSGKDKSPAIVPNTNGNHLNGMKPGI